MRLKDAEFRVTVKILYPFTVERRQFIITKYMTELVGFGKPRAEQRNVVNLLILA
ncbi:MAG TPA: hypothetical protein PKW98_20115 [Candidatus Wallbacteria bacterium]|nr:hypothetical protein [Candidatus Wallbacteria bacterium]